MDSLQSLSPNLSSTPAATLPEPSWKIKLLYDGQCPLCLREVSFLRKKDAGRGLVELVDIAEPNYTPADHGGISFAAAMGRIHAVLPDGTVIRNVEVFRQVYTILGIGWLYAPTTWPGIGGLVDKFYGFWADRRLAWTGRPSLDELVAQRQEWPLHGTTDKTQCAEMNGVSSSRCQID